MPELYTLLTVMMTTANLACTDPSCVAVQPGKKIQSSASASHCVSGVGEQMNCFPLPPYCVQNTTQQVNGMEVIYNDAAKTMTLRLGKDLTRCD